MYTPYWITLSIDDRSLASRMGCLCINRVVFHQQFPNYSEICGLSIMITLVCVSLFYPCTLIGQKANGPNDFCPIQTWILFGVISLEISRRMWLSDCLENKKIGTENVRGWMQH